MICYVEDLKVRFSSFTDLISFVLCVARPPLYSTPIEYWAPRVLARHRPHGHPQSYPHNSWLPGQSAMLSNTLHHAQSAAHHIIICASHVRRAWIVGSYGCDPAASPLNRAPISPTFRISPDQRVTLVGVLNVHSQRVVLGPNASGSMQSK